MKVLNSDIDGVMCKGDVPIAGAAEALAKYRAAERFPYRQFNEDRARICGKTRGFGIPVSGNQVVSTAEATARFSAEAAHRRRILAVGERSLRESVRSAGMALRAEAPAVAVVELDREFTYAKFRMASRTVGSGAELIGAHPDLMLLAATDAGPGRRKRDAIIGKPEPFLNELAPERQKAPRQQKRLSRATLRPPAF
ncbi:MAG: hypothetical protein OXI01_04860 [Albidovulum sp.]|nr:hypothetical protein [Albidovulum sp.]